MTNNAVTLIDLKLSDPNHALREALFNIGIVALDNETVFPDGLDEDLYPLVSVANVRAAASVLLAIAVRVQLKGGYDDCAGPSSG